MLLLIVLGIISLTLVNVSYSQEEDFPFVKRVEDLPPLEEVFTTYRLPNTTRPNSYDITLRTWIHEGNFDFTGNVRINITAVEAINSITLHHRYLMIGDVRLWTSDANPTSVQIQSATYNATFEFLTVSAVETLTPANTYVFDIDYSGTLRNDQEGFYRSSYLDDEGRRIWLATTKFEPTDARHAFPAFNEPNLKSRFKLRITHDPSYSAISNMPETSKIENADGSVTTEFDETPLMSSYLVAFIISDFGNLASSEPREIPQRNFARPNAVHQSHLMLNAGERILDALSNYFGVDYSLPKMDQAAPPDFAAGAMWFGNLVSPTWWTYLWLNEGFARFVEHIGVDLVYQNWQMIDYFVVRTLQNVFQSDAAATSRPMSFYVEDPRDIDNQFNNIAYDKAGSVIRMFMNIFTEETFVKGLNLYLNEKSFSNAEEADLFNAPDTAVGEDNAIATYIDVTTVMSSWSQQAGFAVVTVIRNYGPLGAPQIVTLYQQRYFTTQPSVPDNTTWWIPINFATEQNPNFDDTRADQWYPQNYAAVNFTFFVWTLTDDSWLIITKQEAYYYRVLYDQRNYQLLSDAMVRNISVFHTLNRAQLMDDTYNFVRTERLGYDTFLTVARFLEFDDEYVSWYPAITAFTTIERYFSGHEDYPVFREFLRDLVEHLYDTVRVRDIVDEPQMRKYSRTIAINWACNMGSVHCRSDATRELRGLIETGGDFHQNVRDVLYCAALRSGSSADFDFVWNRLLNSNVTATRNLLITALGCSTNTRLLREFIRSSLSSTSDRDIVYRTDEPYRVFNAVYQGGLIGLETAINFLNENAQEAYGTYGANNFGTILTNMAQRVGNQQLIPFNALLNSVLSSNLATNAVLTRAREYVEENSNWLNRHGEIIATWFDQNF